ncbi:putative AAA+ ATPase domain, P-loop containing nucleoside triphosphate hydrolase [Helianthus debilis subsp. tardiflorus]
MSTVDIAVSVIAKLLEYTARPIIQPFDYILHHNRNINGLQTQISHLENTQFEVQQQVDVAQRNGEVVLPTVQAWLAKANSLATESDKFLSNQVVTNHNCISGSCPNLKLIYKSSREAKKKSIAVNQVVKGGKFDRVSHPARLPPIWPSNDGAFIGELDGFESRKAQLRLMMEALGDDSVNIIGVYGMGGIGKTTFVEEVAKQAYARQLFDEMVMVVVSHKPNLRKLQGDLAEMLELNLKEEGEVLRTVRLRERLNQVKRILIILDDLWTPIDLRTIGIPQGNLHKGCKIILTSRSLDVCNAMSTQRNFHMDVLSEVESWNLFKKMAGDTVESPDLNPIATKVAKRCSGLPLAIVTVARALRHRSKYAWRDALRQLRSSTVKGVYASVFASLELSFNFLKDEETKACFLLCSLFKEDLDISIEFLVRYGIGLRLFQDVHTLEEARDRVHTIVENLKACCLLLDSDVEDCFRMHDVTRDFLLSVACRGLYIFLEKMTPEYLESSNENKLGNYYAISMVLNNLDEFPIGIDCPKLQLWRLEGSTGLVEFSGNKNYFDGMKELKVVIMHHISIPFIPSSFLTVRKLVTLCLEHCKLGDLSHIKELKHLEILSLVHSDIEKLPKEIRELSRLRLLDLSDCKNLTVIPFGVFSNLSNLECLYMMNSFRQWGVHGQSSQTQATLDELKNLSHLTTFETHIPDVNLFPKDLLFRNLVRFKLFIGMDISQVINYSYPKTLRLTLHQGLSLHGGIYKLLKSAQHLILDYSIIDYLEDLNSIVYDLRKGFKHLRCLEVYGYTGVESLIDTKIFPVLENLKVVSAADLKMICYDHLPDQSFCELRELMLSILPELTCLWVDPMGNVCLRNLKTIYVSDCHKLKDLVSQSTARDLSELQRLYVSSCEDLKVILFKDAGDSSSRIVLSKLKSIKLEFLPNLSSFCPETATNLVQEALFNSKVDFPSLEELTLRELHSVNEIWPRQFSTANFRSLRILIIFGCENLVLVFPSYIQKMLQNLEILYIEWCDSVEEVCGLDEHDIHNENDASLATLPCVRDLILGKLPLLKHLWWNKDINPHAYTSLKNLNSLHLYECDGLIHLFSFCAMKSLVQLQELKVRSCKMMKTIFANEGDDGIIVLSELRYVSLEDLPELSSFCKGSSSLHFPSLDMIEIKSCPKMKAFVASDVHQEENLFNEKVALPNLQALYLDGLSSMIGIWHTELPDKSFNELQVLKVINCDQLLDLGPINMLPRLQIIEEIHVINCASLEQLFAIKYAQTHQNLASVSLIKLVDLVLRNLPSLRQIWWDRSKTQNETSRFQRLASVEVASCELLDCIFPVWVARGVPRLQKLKVESCTLMKAIVEYNGRQSEPDDIILPQVCSIELENLPNLVHFCTRMSELRWLSLKELRIMNCSKMGSFVSTSSLENDSNSIKVFFVEKVVFPSLEKLRIDNLECVNTLWHTDTKAEAFSQLSILEVRNCNNLVKLIPSSLLPRLQNLEELHVNQCRLLEMILEQLEENSMEKVMFPKVHTVRLIKLPKLACFISGNRSFEWPNLERLVIEDCPTMKMFSLVGQIVPKLNAIEVGYGLQVWNGDLDSTIQHLFVS